MVNKVKITYVKSDYNSICYLNREQLQDYDLDYKIDALALTFGSLTIKLKTVIVTDNSLDPNRLYLSLDLKDRLYIPENTVLQIKKVDSAELELGPFIGVFINQEKVDHLSSGKGITAYTHFSNACKSLYGLCCFFSIQNIDWDNNLVKGLYKKNSDWIMTTFPLPKVIYDRNVEKNCRIESIALRKNLAGTCDIVNAMPKLKKLETIKALRKNPNLKSVIPETAPYKSISQLETMLRDYPSLYLKPDSMSKGKGIFRLSKTLDNEYIIEHRNKEENESLILDELTDLDKILSEFSSKGGGYLVQAEINKASFRGNPFDFRLLYQKDWQGLWQPSGIATRIGAAGSIITSPRSGGVVEDFSKVLKEVFDEDFSTPKGLYEDIVTKGREICLAIENEFGTCVELGLDMCIDVDRKVWIIEVNGKPLKVSLKRLNDPDLILRCNKRPIEYAVYLTGFQSADTSLGGLMEN